MTNWAIFQQQREAARSPQGIVYPRAGRGTQVTSNAFGHSVSRPDDGPTFNHPWRPFLGADRVTFSLGAVQSLGGEVPLEPKIRANGGALLPMSGKTGTTPTPLALKPDVVNSAGVSWCVLEVHPDDATGELMKDSLCEIIHTDSPISHARTFGRVAIAMILWSGRHPFRAESIRMANLTYVRLLPKPGDAFAPRHLFL